MCLASSVMGLELAVDKKTLSSFEINQSHFFLLDFPQILLLTSEPF